MVLAAVITDTSPRGPEAAVRVGQKEGTQDLDGWENSGSCCELRSTGADGPRRDGTMDVSRNGGQAVGITSRAEWRP